MEKKNTILPTDDRARAQAQTLIRAARSAALAVVDDAGVPHVSRIGFAATGAGILSLMSSLAFHTGALRQQPRCSLLLGDVPQKGDPLASPRLTLSARARFIPRDDPAHGRLRDLYLERHPKSRLYVDFDDFSFVRFELLKAALNGGFGKAFDLTRDDLLSGA
jgi:heme oxygenase (biliverdin-IX-beta and delta-forming)